ncbi:unnamed protein product [Schistocephalus solidus]|uniref:TIP120 domain-containing protein n=1 Tax=Schistocephalus solidus TaxID=70667 RepID=A0A183SX32_SCHSO|nr:unnamed protein product [Schistocephalus solidus]
MDIPVVFVGNFLIHSRLLPNWIPCRTQFHPTLAWAGPPCKCSVIDHLELDLRLNTTLFGTLSSCQITRVNGSSSLDFYEVDPTARGRRDGDLRAANSALTRCTLVTAAKYILVVSEGGAAGTFFETTDPATPHSAEASASPGGFLDRAGDNPTRFPFEEAESVLCGSGGASEGAVPLTDFLARLLDPDLNVRKAALLTLNTAAHHRSGLLIRPLLNRGPPTLLQVLYRETLVRPELIREVEMGPFKRQEDDGLELRKSAYECLSTLLDNCVDSLQMSDFLDLLINGLKDHNDIRLLVYHMLQRIIQLQPVRFISRVSVKFRVKFNVKVRV